MRRTLAFLALMAVASPVLAEPVCNSTQIMIAALKSGYGEVQIWEGLLEVQGQKSTPIIMFASVKTRTWTIVANPAPDVLCMMMKGSSFDYPGLPKARGNIL